MSWDASLNTRVDGKTITIPGAEWNHTHNCNHMINAAMKDLGIEKKGPWWKQIDGKTASESNKFLGDVINVLQTDPIRFVAMNPDNGWGSYDSLLSVLGDMRDTGIQFPSATWNVWG